MDELDTDLHSACRTHESLYEPDMGPLSVHIEEDLPV